MPRKFQFRLEPVLKYRRHLEDLKKRDLARARATVMEQNKILLALLRDEAAGKKMMGELKQGGVRVLDLRVQEQFLVAVARRIRRAYEELQKRLFREQKIRRELVEARKQVRVLERLREKREQAWAYQLSMDERKELDEIAVQRHHLGKGTVS